MLFQRCQNAEVALHAPRIVVGNISVDHVDEVLLAGKALTIVALSLQDAPEPFHGAVVQALSYPRHTLSHAGLLQLVVKHSIGVLETSVAVE